MKSSWLLIAAVIGTVFCLQAGGADGTIFSDDFAKENGKWKIDLHRNRLQSERKIVKGKSALVIKNNGKTKSDTAFIIKTQLLPVPDTAKNYQIFFGVTANLKPEKFYGGHKKHVNHILFYNESGELLESRYFRYFADTDKYRQNVFKGKIPAGTAAMEVSFGGDYPDILPGQYMALSDFLLQVK